MSELTVKPTYASHNLNNKTFYNGEYLKRTSSSNKKPIYNLYIFGYINGTTIHAT